VYEWLCIKASRQKPYPKTPRENKLYFVLCCCISLLFWLPMLIMPPILVTSIIPDSDNVSSTAIRSAGVLFGFVAVFTLSLVNTAAGSGALAAKNGPACQHRHATVWSSERAVCCMCNMSVPGYWKCETCAKAWGPQLGVHCRDCTLQPDVSLFQEDGCRWSCCDRDRTSAGAKRCCRYNLNILNMNLDVVLAFASVGVEFFQLSAFTFQLPNVPWSSGGGVFDRIKAIFTAFVVQFEGSSPCMRCLLAH
jgi:hypothetical protein